MFLMGVEIFYVEAAVDLAAVVIIIGFQLEGGAVTLSM